MVLSHIGAPKRATSPTRRTRPFCRYRDVSPVSAGEFTPKEEAKLHVILNAVKNPTEELTGIYFFTLVVGYFAIAQYDALFNRLCEGSEATKQSPGRVEVYGVDVPFSFGGIFR